ncbi:VWA domain-containing protein [Nocardioides lentus]|uniref:VWA domain-containing protein n=1 Tax=Nocardioides lentus TaxID=338077 RepID=A0ABN2PEX3_9ACTN
MTTSAPVRHPGEEVLLGFTRAVRAAGVAVTMDRAQGYLEAVALLDAGDPEGVRRAGHATLCGGPADLDRHDQVFDTWFDPRGELPRSRPREERPAPRLTEVPETDGDGGGDEMTDDVIRARASEAEVLRHRDVATLEPSEKARLEAMFATLRCRVPRRRTARHRAWHRGEVDAPATLRASLRRMGEPSEISWRRRGTKPRRVVLLLDVSGSMSGYADALLRVAHRFVSACPAGASYGVEVFTVGTRLTRVTRALAHADPERALVAAGESVPDWSGGTRLGESLQAFTDRWGAAGLARGAVVVIASDGWERGDVDLLAGQVARLQRLAHRVVWVNPHRGKAGYEPVQRGVQAVLPHVDDFLAGHSLATYAELVEVVARA